MMRAIVLVLLLAVGAGCASRSPTGSYGVTPVYLKIRLGAPRQVIERGDATGLVYVARGKTYIFWFVDSRLVRTETKGRISAETKKMLEEFEVLAKELQAEVHARR